MPQPAVPRIGHDSPPVWMRLTLEQRGAAGDWVLALPTTGLHDLQFHGPFGPDGRALADPVFTGLDHPFATRTLSHERFVFRVHLPAPGTYTAWLRVATRIPQSLALSAWDPAEYLVSRQDKRLFDGVSYGILATLLVVGLALSFALRDRTFGWYVVSCASALLTVTSFNGHAAHYLFPDWPTLVERSYVLGPTLWLIAGAGFARGFLELRSRAPGLHRASTWVLVAALATGVVGLAGPLSLAQRGVEVVAVAGVLYFVVASVVVARRGYLLALWYLAGQSLLFLAVLWIVLANWGVLRSPFMIANGLQLGILLELIVFGFAMSLRLRVIERQKRDLQLHAHHLAIAAQTDPLTGLLNRAGLEERSRALLQPPGRHGLMMIDLDHFKPVNDVHGHRAGDEVLVEIARRLAAAVRGPDTVARVGGDEFVVLVAGGADPAVLQGLARRLQAAIREPVPFTGGTARVDCSIGITAYPQGGDDLDALLLRADRAMYRAKDAGRACFVCDSGDPGTVGGTVG